jgi:hypothetical protein
MIEPKNPSDLREAGVERTTKDIRQDMAKEIENITQTIEQIGGRINKKLDWREYLNDYPYWALGAAAGLGYLTSGIFVSGTTPKACAIGASTDENHNSFGSHLAGTAGFSLIKATLLGIATKSAVRWITNASSTVAANSGERSRQHEMI